MLLDNSPNGLPGSEAGHDLDTTWMDFVHVDTPEAEYKKAIEGEISNFRILNEKVAQIGCVPPMCTFRVPTVVAKLV